MTIYGQIQVEVAKSLNEKDFILRRQSDIPLSSQKSKPTKKAVSITDKSGMFDWIVEDTNTLSDKALTNVLETVIPKLKDPHSGEKLLTDFKKYTNPNGETLSSLNGQAYIAELAFNLKAGFIQKRFITFSVLTEDGRHIYSDRVDLKGKSLSYILDTIPEAASKAFNTDLTKYAKEEPDEQEIGR